MAARSVRTVVATAGRCTLTTTSSPERRVAACTWAIDAAARGWRSNAGEQVLEGPAQILLDHRPDRFERFGRDPVAQQAELADQLGGEDALARGEDLAQLDVGRPEGLERQPQPAGQAGPGQLGPPAAGARRRSIRYQPPTARASSAPTRTTRRPGGRRRRRSSSGTWPAVAARSWSMPARHRSCVEVDQPGRGGAEGPDRQVGGGDRRHPRTLSQVGAEPSGWTARLDGRSLFGEEVPVQHGGDGPPDQRRHDEQPHLAEGGMARR